MTPEQGQRSDPAVSVVVPVHDGAEHLPGLRRMLGAQRMRDAEVIVVDDGSTDATPQLLQAWADEAGDVPVRLLRLEPQQGASAARRAGVRAARGRWVWFADADDRFDPDLLVEARGLGEQHGADLVCFRARAEHEDGSPHPVVLYGRAQPSAVLTLEGRDAADAVFAGTVMGYLWDKLFSRDLVTRAFAGTADLRTHEDLLLLLNALELHPRMVLMPGSPYVYVVRGTSLSNARHPSFRDLGRCAEQADVLVAHQGAGPHWGTFQARYIGLSAIEDAARKGTRADVRAAADVCGPRLRAASPRMVARDHGWSFAARVAAARRAPEAYGRVYGTARDVARALRRARR